MNHRPTEQTRPAPPPSCPSALLPTLRPPHQWGTIQGGLPLTAPTSHTHIPLPWEGGEGQCEGRGQRGECPVNRDNMLPACCQGTVPTSYTHTHFTHNSLSLSQLHSNCLLVSQLYNDSLNVSHLHKDSLGVNQLHNDSLNASQLHKDSLVSTSSTMTHSMPASSTRTPWVSTSSARTP